MVKYYSYVIIIYKLLYNYKFNIKKKERQKSYSFSFIYIYLYNNTIIIIIIGKYIGNRPVKLRKSTWKDRNIDVRKKKPY